MEKLAKDYYAKSHQIWTDDPVPESGLLDEEKESLESCQFSRGKALILFGGAGREAIALAQAGAWCISLDNQWVMVEKGKNAARKLDLPVKFIMASVFDLPFSDAVFNFSLAFARMYSTIPTRRKRIEFLNGVRRILQPGGVFVYDFYLKELPFRQKKVYRIRHWIAALIRGNVEGQMGDGMWNTSLFCHAFKNRSEVISEAEEAGFIVSKVKVYGEIGYAILRKKI